MSKTLYVGNLNYRVTNGDLEGLFANEGTVVSARIITDRENENRSKGFGFVEMSTADEAQTAMSSLNETSFMERSLRVNIAEERKPRTFNN